jgi:hypothetical protein
MTAKDGAGIDLPPECLEPYYCDALEATVAELRALDYETVTLHLAWRRGKNLAEWCQYNKP